jgi:hypothetical protein
MRGTLRGAGAALVSVALVVGLAACGDDSDDGGTAATTTSEATSGTSAAFCDAIVQFNTAINTVDLEPDTSKADITAAGQQLAPLFDKVASNAPARLADQAKDLNERAVQPLLQGDDSTFQADESFQQYGKILDAAVDGCDFHTSSVTGVDYAFQDAPDTEPAGTVAFRFTNKSTDEDHEMVILRKNDDTTESWDQLMQLPEEQASQKTTYMGSTQAHPGQSGAALTTLTPGSYVMICFLPVGGAEDGAPHFTKGMVHEFAVQ